MRTVCLISQGSWIVKQSVGKKACLVGQALEINYFHGRNYLEVKYRRNHMYIVHESWHFSIHYLQIFHFAFWPFLESLYTISFQKRGWILWLPAILELCLMGYMKILVQEGKRAVSKHTICAETGNCCHVVRN